MRIKFNMYVMIQINSISCICILFLSYDASYYIAFVMRPVGGLVIGSMGDKVRGCFMLKLFINNICT